MSNWHYDRDVVLSLTNIIEGCLRAKRLANLRPIYVKELGRYLHCFSRELGDPLITAVSLDHLEGWLDKPAWSPGTRATGMNRLSALFAYATRKGYIDRNPVDRLERVRLERKPPTILTPDEAKQLLKATLELAPTMMLYVTLALFAGVRPAELEKLNGRDVQPSRRIVRIDAASSKVRTRRIIDLDDNAVLWLQTITIPDGPITPKQKRRKLRKLRVAMGWSAWPKDVLRHSFASYAMAKHRDAAKVADWCGNSIGVLHRHYRQLVDPEDSIAFWSIAP